MPAAKEVKQCRAFAKSTGFRCKCCTLPHSEYCRHHHPAFSGIISPSSLRKSNLRVNFTERVKEMAVVDEYTSCTHSSIRNLELDHKQELHSIAALCNNLEFVKNHRFQDLNQITRKVRELVNAETNLNWTTRQLNQQKFNAVYLFHGDYMLQPERISEGGITDYLRICGVTNRCVTRRINNSMLLSYDFLMQQLQVEIDWEAQLCDALHDMVVDFMCKC